MTKDTPTLAVFDFDGTIYGRDSFLDFICFTHSKTALWLAYFRLAPWILLYFLGSYSNHRLKEQFFRYFYRNWSVEQLVDLGGKFAEQIIPTFCFPSALKVIQWHRERGHDLYLLTASSALWLEAWAEQQEMTIIGTEWKSVEGKYTGKIHGQNCYGPEKAKRLQEILAKQKPQRTYGYGDHPSDQYFLQILSDAFPQPLNAKQYERWQQWVQS